jgi:PAS domain S-box-containing protein
LPHKSASIKVFSRFNRTVVSVFILVVFIAFSLAATRYFRELFDFEQQADHTMSQNGANLNGKLTHMVQAINGLLEFANYCLKHPKNTVTLLPDLAQGGELFYLKQSRLDVINQRKQLSGNITGIGNINNFDLAIKQELAMANALTPAFVTAQHSNPEVTWFYYVSQKRFVSLYPWVSRDIWHYRDQLLERQYFTEIKENMAKDNLFWSPPYNDSAGKGLIASLASGVSQHDKFVGALVMDINLAQLGKLLPPVNEADQGYLLLDKNQNVLLHKGLTEVKITRNTYWQDVKPDVFKYLNNKQLRNLAPSQKVAGWFIQKQTLPVNQWVLIKYQPYNNFIAPLAGEFLFWFLILLSGLVAFIVLIYWLTRKTFIKPATEFIEHIENCAQGDSGKIKPTPDWQHWFYVVEDIFSQNRSLMQQLKDKNADLDKRVKEKTHDLLATSQQHQRDYALLRSVMNAMQELIIFSDDQGQLIGCNSALEKFVNNKQRALLGKKAAQLLPHNLATAFTTLSQQAYQDSAQKSYQQVVKTSEHSYELFSRRFYNEQGESLGTINIFRDVTKAYAIQAALEQAKNQAEHANQAKGQFLANMSHEIRTPINAIQGMMYLLAKTSLNRVQQQYLTNAETASKSLLYLIDELLDLAKIEAGKMPLLNTQVLIDDIIDKALKLNIAKAHAKGLPITIDIDIDVPEVINTDEIRLVQVLTNLINNAVKFTNQGEVSLKISVVANDIRFSVIDSGIGIAKDKQASLFNVFTQADESVTRKYGGSGLGLSICRQIVTLLGGKLQLLSNLGQGSEFSFTLPLSLLSTPKKVLNRPFSLVTVTELLPRSLINKLESIGWRYRHFEQLVELNTLAVKENDVLLIAAEDMRNDPLLFEKIAVKFNLVAFCLPMLTELDESLSRKLDRLGIPWFIIEKPFYRALINEITQVALTEQKPVVVKTASEEEKLAEITVLLVEDNLVNQMVARELLTSMDAEVVIANNGQEALTMLDEHLIDLVLMDIQMPIMDGLTATKKIREIEKYSKLPIIAMTAHARKEDHQKSINAGMNLHIAKPVTYEKLLTSIKSVLL